MVRHAVRASARGEHLFQINALAPGPQAVPREHHRFPALRPASLAVRAALAIGLAAGASLLAPAAVAQTVPVDRDAAPSDNEPRGEREHDEAKTLASVQVNATTVGSYVEPATFSSTKLILTNRETPQSTTVITRQQMQDWGNVSIKDVLGNTAGVYVSTSASQDRPSFNVRGSEANLVQIDGVQQFPGGRRPDVSGDSVAYERVEVLRGANGLLTGAGEPTATVNLIRKRAISRELEGDVAISLGSWDNRRAEFDLSTPLTDGGRVRARVAGAYQDRDSFLDRYGREHRTVYATVEGDLGDNTLLRAGVEWTKAETRGSINTNAAPYYFSDGTRVGRGRGLTGMTAAWSNWPTEENTYFAGIDHAFDNGWHFNAITTYNTIEMQGGSFLFLWPTTSYFDPDGSHDYIYDEGWGDGPQRFGRSDLINSSRDVQKTVDVSLQGPLELFGRSHDIVVGANGFDRSRTTYGYDADYAAIDQILFSDWNLFTWDGNIPRYQYTELGRQSEQTTKSYGGFVVSRWNLADPLKLILGARLTNWEVSTDRYNPRTGAYLSTSGAYKVTRELTPYAGLVYDVGRDWSVYASYTDAFRPQDAYDANDQILEPIVGKSYEVGAKAELFDKCVNATFAVFRNVLDNVAEFDDRYPLGYVTPGGNTPYRSSGKGNTSEGFELELSGEITRGWNLYGGLTHVRTTDSTGERIQRDLPATLFRVFTAWSLPSTPWTFGAGMNWQAGYRVESERPTGAPRNPDGSVPVEPELRVQAPVALFNAMARYDVSDAVSLQLNVSNLFDKAYFNAISSFAGEVSWGEPRNVSVTARYRF